MFGKPNKGGFSCVVKVSLEEAKPCSSGTRAALNKLVVQTVRLKF